jgi:preprotein translocase subunit YajC
MLLAAAKTTSHGLPPELIFLYIIVIGAVYYFYLRPRNKRMKEQRTQTRKVEVGDRAQTIGGFVGTVVKNETDLITLRTDAGVELQFVPAAIARRYEVVAPAIPESTDDHITPDDHPTEGDAK